MAGGLRYETGREMPPGMQELAADKLVEQLRNAAPVAADKNQNGRIPVKTNTLEESKWTTTS